MFKLWIKSIKITIILSSIWSFLIILDRGLNIYFPNRLFATMAFFMIGLSLLSSSIVYFTKKYSYLLGLRMYFGITGFIFGLLHAINSLLLYLSTESIKPIYEFNHSWEIINNIFISNQIAFIFGVLGLVLFTYMAIISMKRFVIQMGGVLWRDSLRVIGYLAYIFITIHFFIKNFNEWLNVNNWGSFIPTSLLLFLFSIIVILFRLILHFSLKKKMKS